MKNLKLFLSLLALLTFVLVIPAFPQSQHPDARLAGSVTDPSGARVAGARITARPQGASASPLTTESAPDGSYALALPSGRYSIVFAKESFSSRETELTLQSGESRTLSLRLELAPMSSRVLVTGQTAPTIEEQSPAPSSILTGEQIAQRQAISLPDLLYTQPGIAIA